MSTSLYWSRVPVEQTEYDLYSLKWALARKLWDSDGSCGESSIIVDKELIPFLDGIIVGNDNGDMAEDAKQLKNAIEDYGKVQLFIHS
jgi:hypothetical protein